MTVRRFPGRLLAVANRQPASAANLAVAGPPRKATKYHAKKAVGLMGEVYDSQHERRVAYWLESRQRAGLLHRWSWGPTFELQGPDELHPDVPRITLKVDFVVWLDERHWYGLDAKGVSTRDFKTKAKLWAAVHPDNPLRVIGKDMQERPA